MLNTSALRLRKRTAAIVAAASIAGLAVTGAVVVNSDAATPAKAVAAQPAALTSVQNLPTAAAASVPAAAQQKAAADKAAAAKAATDKAAADKAAAEKAAADKAAAAKAAEQAAADKAAAARAAAAQVAASRSETRTALSGSPQQIAAQLVPADQLASFSQIISHESGWNVYATNPSSGAYGLGQALPGNKMASAGADWQTSASTQIQWALGYMDSRYGSPNAAWAFWQANNWY